MGILAAVVPLWGRLLFLVTLVAGVWGHGYFTGTEHGRKVLNEYIVQVSLQAGKQMQQTNEIISKQLKVTEEANSEHQKKIDRIKSYYKSLELRRASGAAGGSPLPEVSKPPTGADATTAYNRLVETYFDLEERATETTQQLIDLQDWILEQVKINGPNSA